MKRWTIGDIHGRFAQLKRALQKAGVDYEKDEVISLGDLVDRGPEPFECIFELMKITNLIAVQGNHDLYMMDYLHGYKHFLNGNHGSAKTLVQYGHLTREEKAQALTFFESQVPYHIDKDNRLFVHGGFDRYEPVATQSAISLCQDRHFWKGCLSMQGNVPEKIACVDDFKEIYIGHTPVTRYINVNGRIKEAKNEYDPNVITSPVNISNMWNMDTGAGFSDGCVTVMNIETKEIFQAFVDERDIKETK
jgi:serine/threonine protein phosphatase 1